MSDERRRWAKSQMESDVEASGVGDVRCVCGGGGGVEQRRLNEEGGWSWVGNWGGGASHHGIFISHSSE